MRFLRKEKAKKVLSKIFLYTVKLIKTVPENVNSLKFIDKQYNEITRFQKSVSAKNFQHKFFKNHKFAKSIIKAHDNQQLKLGIGA